MEEVTSKSSIADTFSTRMAWMYQGRLAAMRSWVG
jgi:hypothetical protein